MPRTVAVVLAVAVSLAFAGCGSSIAGADGGLGGSCTTPVQGSCRHQTGLFCYEYGGVTTAALATLMEQCTADADEPGTWSSGACSHAGAVGGCRAAEQGTCVAVWLYVGTTADAMASCAQQGGTWVSP
jgi:hypothetical protein